VQGIFHGCRRRRFATGCNRGDRCDSPRRAQATGTSFNYLLATAKIESDLDLT
jgi:hypothetical protein